MPFSLSALVKNQKPSGGCVLDQDHADAGDAIGCSCGQGRGIGVVWLCVFSLCGPFVVDREGVWRRGFEGVAHWAMRCKMGETLLYGSCVQIFNVTLLFVYCIRTNNNE